MKRAYHGDWMDALPSRFINEIPDESVEKNELGFNENDDFEFNQDNSIEFDGEYRSPGWDRYKKNKILKWKK
jgi:DNA helicase-2/ATP-dependent DNA helicase PcrA